MASIDLGTDRISKFLCAINNPHLKYPIIHVAGTNGKGTTVQMISHLLIKGTSLKVGQFNSPHFLVPRDSIRINGFELSKEDDLNIMELVRERMARFNINLTLFEQRTLIALLAFERHNVDLAIVEVGMGGLLDATNVFPIDNKLLCVITNIGFDHKEFLGTTIEQIADHKAGIIVHPDALVVVSKQTYLEQVKQAVLRRCPESNCIFVEDHSEQVNFDPKCELFLLGKGLFLDDNYRTAVLSLSYLRNRIHTNHKRRFSKVFHALNTFHIDDSCLFMTDYRWPGRMEFFQKKNNRFEVSGTYSNILVDCAHNADGAKSLKTAIDLLYPNKRITWVFGMSISKDPIEFLKILVQNDDRVWTTGFGSVEEMPWIHCWDSGKLKNLISDSFPSVGVFELGAIEHLLENIVDDEIFVITGSIYLISELYSVLSK